MKTYEKILCRKCKYYPTVADRGICGNCLLYFQKEMYGMNENNEHTIFPYKMNEVEQAKWTKKMSDWQFLIIREDVPTNL